MRAQRRLFLACRGTVKLDDDLAFRMDLPASGDGELGNNWSRVPVGEPQLGGASGEVGEPAARLEVQRNLPTRILVADAFVDEKFLLPSTFNPPDIEQPVVLRRCRQRPYRRD